MKTQKILMKMLALMLTVFMLVPHVVWAEGDTGSTPAETAEATSTADDEEATPENGENDPETDPEADPDSEPAQGRSLPQESADEESDADNEISGEAPAGALRGAGAEEGEEESEPEPEPPLKIEDSDGKQLSFTATLTDYEMPDDGADVRIAIWSVKGGQDDLRWSIMQKNEEGRYSFTCNLKNHKTEGEYRIHTYLRMPDNRMQFLYGETFTVDSIRSGSIDIENKNEEAGTCDIVIRGLMHPSGITFVQVPVWSKSNQSDIIWYTAKKSGEDWVVPFDIAKHSYNSGTYKIHVYATCALGVTCLACNTSVSFEAESLKTEIKAVMEDKQVRLTCAKIKIPNAVAVHFAVWSKVNGQDDLRWFTPAVKNSAAEQVIPLTSCKDFGDYAVHVYVRDSAGKLTIIGSTSFTIEKPGAKTIIGTGNDEDGTFKVEVSDITGAESIAKVEIPIWSKVNGQDDIIWYQAVKQKDGSYTVSSGIDRHKYSQGEYCAHVYITDTAGTRFYACNTTFSVNVGNIEVSAVPVEENVRYLIKAENVLLPGEISSMQAAVWSTSNGQDDLVWYTMAKQGSTAYSLDLELFRHKSKGLFNAHVYANMKDGSRVLIGATTFSVTANASGSLTVGNTNSVAGTFDAVVTVDSADPELAYVKVAAWTASDQNDLAWYTAEKQSNGTYKAAINPANHKGNLGTYNVHAYAQVKNGYMVMLEAATYNFNPPATLIVMNDQGRGRKRLLLKNAPSGLSKVEFPIWSEKNGQDDIVWYTATKMNSTTWQAVIDSANHKNSGTFIVHAYGTKDGTRSFISNYTFNFPESDFGRNGWFYENGYKLYYDHGELVKDVDSILGPQSSYLIRVNRTTCTVTVYAYDSAKRAYIIPVKTFLCSPGTPWEPSPTGTFHTSAKYRWKAMNGPTFAQYATRIVDHVLFHSIPCPDTGKPWDSYQVPAYKYNMLGQPASQGCIRLQCINAKWIYDRCSLGTTVLIYDSPDPGPFGKPALTPIPADQNWDPTDPSVNR